MTELWMALLYAESAGPVQDMLFGMADERFRQSFLHTRANLPVLEGGGYHQAWQQRLGIQRAWAAFFETYPVVLTPTFCQPAYPIDHDVEGVETLKQIMASFSPLPAIAGLGLPALSAPVGMAHGMPVGAQIIARWFEDDRCLAAGQAIERKTGAMIPIDPTQK